MDQEMTDKRSDWVGAFGAMLFALTLYLPFLSVNYDLNGLYEKAAVEEGMLGTLFYQNHLLYRPVSYWVYQAAVHSGFSGNSLHILQIVTAVFGALGIGFAYLVFLQIGQDRLVAFLASLWLATSWAFWYFSTDVSYISLAALFAAAAIAVFLRAESNWSAAVAGILAGLAVLTWQANALLIPVIVICALLLKPSGNNHSLLAKTAVSVASSLLLTVVTYVAVGIFVYGQRTPVELLRWFFRYGTGLTLPMWGQWSLARVSSAFGTLLSSILPVNPRLVMGEFPDLAPPSNAAYQWSLLALVLLGGLLAIQLITNARKSKSAVRVVAWAFASYAIYLGFIIWWDPFEPKWFLIPNLFLGMVMVACCGPRPATLTKSLLLILTMIIATATFSSTIWPRHSEEKRPMRLARCVASKMSGEDLFLATDWAWTGYLRYLHQRQVISVLEVAPSSPTKEAMVEKIRDATVKVQNAEHHVYMVDFSSYADGHAEWLQSQTGFTPDDMSGWDFEPGFVCDGIKFLRLRNITGQY